MKEKTTGLEVMTVGISLGGFMAAILASSLNAKFCLDFAGQFSLLHHWTHVETNSFLQAMYSKNSNLEKHIASRGILQYIILSWHFVSRILSRPNMQ